MSAILLMPSESQVFSNVDFLELSRELEKHHGLFYRLWNLGKPIFTTSVPTAAVVFDPVGEVIDFQLNYSFWQTLTLTRKLFIICHECLHVALNHGLRMRGAPNPDLVNQVLDIVVNHSLVDQFGFVRAEVDPNNEYCWVDTVFDPQANLPTDKSVEYYYNLLQQQNNCPSAKNSPAMVDCHQGLSDQNFDSLFSKLSEELSDTEKDSLRSLIESNVKTPGTSSGTGWILARAVKVEKKRKWETVIKKWATKYISDATEDQWSRVDRRFVLLDDQMFLPTEAEAELDTNSRIQVWFFQDTSGSCLHLTDRFFAAALSLPTNRFDVKMHCFDTQVFETTLESRKLYGFGGTSFSCIEQYIQSYIKKHQQPYPKAIFCITDGAGDPVQPEIPAHWHWFLSVPQSCWSSAYLDQCVPKTCKKYYLEDFE